MFSPDPLCRLFVVTAAANGLSWRERELPAPIMSNAWLAIPLEDYEGHMNAPGVGQLEALREIFENVVAQRRPASVAVLGVAGGNGLEHVDANSTHRVVGVDINPRYLDEVRRRFGSVLNLELHCIDLSSEPVSASPADLVHAALLFEHTGLEPALDGALSLVSTGGIFSAVLQLASDQEQEVAATEYRSIQALKQDFARIDPAHFQELLKRRGFLLEDQATRLVPAGKKLWLGVFRNVGVAQSPPA